MGLEFCSKSFFELSFIQNGMISSIRFPCSNDFASMETIIALNVCEILNPEGFRLLSFLLSP